MVSGDSYEAALERYIDIREYEARILQKISSEGCLIPIPIYAPDCLEDNKLLNSRALYNAKIELRRLNRWY